MRSYRTLEQEGRLLDGIPAFREDHQLITVLKSLQLSRDEIAFAMLDEGLVAPALERDGITLIGGGGSGGSGLHIKSDRAEHTHRFGLPSGQFVRITDVLPELSQNIPPMTDEEVVIRGQTLEAIAALGELVPSLTERGKHSFSLGDAWRVQKDGAVEFWLNPRDPKHARRGWFTLAELREWADDKGPVKDVRRDKSPV